jgi:hypothetical protein
MRRFTELFVWISVLAMLALFLGGLFYSFVVDDSQPHVESTEWHGK